MSARSWNLRSKAKQKYAHSQEHDLSCYNKQIILDDLKEKEYSQESVEQLEQKLRKVPPDLVKDFLNKQASQSQAYVHEECSNFPLFTGTDEWTKRFKELNYNSINLLPFMLKSIAEMENHPQPSSVSENSEEINFPSLYLFLSNVMRGNPTKELNTASKEFLEETFNELLELANTSKGLKDLKELELHIVSENSKPELRTEDINLSTEMNPLKLPVIKKEQTQ